MNAEQRQTAANLWTKPKDLSHWPTCRQLRKKLHPPSPFIITQPGSWYSFYHPTEGWNEMVCLPVNFMSVLSGWVGVHMSSDVCLEISRRCKPPWTHHAQVRLTINNIDDGLLCWCWLWTSHSSLITDCCSIVYTQTHTCLFRVGFLQRQKVRTGQWKKLVKTTVKTGKNWQ